MSHLATYKAIVLHRKLDEKMKGNSNLLITEAMFDLIVSFANRLAPLYLTKTCYLLFVFSRPLQFALQSPSIVMTRDMLSVVCL